MSDEKEKPKTPVALKRERAQQRDDEPAWVLYYHQQDRLTESCAAGEMECHPVSVFGQQFLAYRPTPPPLPKPKEK